LASLFPAAIDQYGAPADDAWSITAIAAIGGGTPGIMIGFEKGVAVCLDGAALSGPELLQSLNHRLGEYGVGRHIYTGDVTIGLKGRIAFECPGLTVCSLHQALEDAVNTRFQTQYRAGIAARWAELV
jgi:argininosuccinate synthase